MKKLFIFIFVLSIILPIIFINDTLNHRQSPSISTIPTPTLVVNKAKIFMKSTSPVLDKKGSSERLIEKVKNRTPLSEEDQLLRKALIFSIGNKSGNVQATSNYNIEYVAAPDVFQVEILNKDINLAKRQTISWLELKGFSKEGICNLPIMFYLNWKVKDELRGTGIEFDPLPEGC